MLCHLYFKGVTNQQENTQRVVGKPGTIIGGIGEGLGIMGQEKGSSNVDTRAVFCHVVDDSGSRGQNWACWNEVPWNRLGTM